MNNPIPSPYHISLQGQAMRHNEQARLRIMIVMIFMLVAYSILGLRLFDVTKGEQSFAELWQQTSHRIASVSSDTAEGMRAIDGSAAWSDPRFQPAIPPVVFPRQSIRDRNGVILAASVPTRSLYVRPHEIQDKAEVVNKINKLFPELSAEYLLHKLNSKSKFVWIKHHLTPLEQKGVLWAGIAGLYLHDDYNRIYPNGKIAAHVLGYTNVDGVGIAGVEQYFNNELTRTDRLKSLNLSIDVRLQNILTNEVAARMEKHQAIGAAGAIFHIPSAEALAMVSLPDFDPNRVREFSDEARKNKLSSNAYELGSVFKTISLALALDSGAVGVHDRFDATQPARYKGGVIHDFHAKNRWLSVPEILAHSSNIGTAKMVERVGAEGQREFLQKLGLFERVGIEFIGTRVPTMPRSWQPIESATISFGHGIAITPLHLIKAMIAVNGGGLNRDLTLLKDNAKPAQRILHEDTSKIVNRLMQAVVQHGTAKSANVEGYNVGAKTGTADKAVAGGYHASKKISSIIAAYPMPNPQYLIFVMFDEPKGTKDTYNYATAGWVAAPAVAEIIKQISPILGVAPQYEAPLDEIDVMIMQAENRNIPTISKPSYVQKTTFRAN
jgi:cell division protein FtsI (penicillin-binding protein 3)